MVHFMDYCLLKHLRGLLGATLILFIIALVAIFSTVSSYIFKREKGEVGIGITLKKKSSDGYSSWAKEKDIKEQSNVECVHQLMKL